MRVTFPSIMFGPDECTTHAVPGYPCGFPPDAEYADLAIPLARGDKVVFMTDGLVERGTIAGYVNLDAVRSLLMHFCGDPEFNRKIVVVILEMFPGEEVLRRRDAACGGHPVAGFPIRRGYLLHDGRRPGAAELAGNMRLRAARAPRPEVGPA